MKRSVPEISRIASGMMRLRDWKRTPPETLDFIKSALEMGITTFDHADIYGGGVCEQLFGDALALEPPLRESMQLVTKCGIMPVSGKSGGFRVKHYDTSKEHIVESVERSLKRLRTDRVDLLLIHRPDPLMDPSEAAEAFSALHESGKVLHFGVSNFSSARLETLAAALEQPLEVNQIECSALHLDPFEDDTLDHCIRRGILPMAWSPLSGGALMDSTGGRAVMVREAMEKVRESHGASSLEVIAVAWLLAHPSGIVPVMGTGDTGRLHGATEAIKVKLTREEWFSIWAASKGEDVP